jgi:uncharacterized protein YicC (UPF0701 family)
MEENFNEKRKAENIELRNQIKGELDRLESELESLQSPSPETLSSLQLSRIEEILKEREKLLEEARMIESDDDYQRLLRRLLY